MAKSKLLATAAMSSAILLVACGGNTQDENTSSTTETVGTELTIEPEEEIVLDVEQVEPVAVVEEMADDVYNELLDLTIVYFDFDKSSIRAEFTEMLDAHAAFLVANPNTMIVLEGHADERGTREYNLALGERRAKQVATYLQIKGVSAAQMDVTSYGEEKPMAVGKTEAEYSQNRRVEIVYK